MDFNDTAAALAMQDPFSRYVRQIALPGIDKPGQSKLRDASVLVVGAGGLGCAALPYLCGAGVGRLIIVDPDIIETSNLHRQPLYRVPDAGRRKAEVARDELGKLNPDVEIEIACERLTPANAARFVAGAQIVVDAADNFAATYVLNDECVRQEKVLVSASVAGFTGYAGAFCGNAPGYRAVFPDLPALAATCDTQGVLGTSVGVIGTIQAQLVLSILLDLDPTLPGRLICVDFRTLRFSGFAFGSAREAQAGFVFIAPGDVTPADLTVDLRSEEEAPTPAFESSLRADADQAEAIAASIERSQRVVLCCRTGLRAWRAANRIRRSGHDNIALLVLG